MPTPQVTCARCVELWREFAEATREHVRLLKAQEQASAPEFHDLDAEIEMAAIRRDSARVGIQVHLKVDHADEPSLTMSA